VAAGDVIPFISDVTRNSVLRQDVLRSAYRAGAGGQLKKINLFEKSIDTFDY
jgi:hypothetical protein